MPDGGFNIYPQGPSEVSATVKAYFALKLAGLAYDDPRLAQARERILALGGMQAANSYVKINLSLFDLYPRASTAPTIPPEIVLLPGNFLYQMSSWTRAIVMPLSIVHATNPRRPVPAGFDLNELFLPRRAARVPPRSRDSFTWRNVFLRLDRLLKLWEQYGSKSHPRGEPSARPSSGCSSARSYTDGAGRHLSAHDVLRSWRSMCWAIRPIIPIAWKRSSSSTPDGGRRRALLLPAVLLAGLGHRHRRVRPGRGRPNRRTTPCAVPPTGC